MRILRNIFYFLLVFFYLGLVMSWDVAVIMGGEDATGEEYSDVEVYNEEENTCHPNQRLYQYIGRATHTAGLFLPSAGIVVCGGVTAGISVAECVSYQNPVSDVLAWSVYRYQPGTQVWHHQGILDTGVQAWGDFGFLQVGGLYVGEEMPSTTSTYRYKNGDTVITEDANNTLPFPRSGECFVRIRTPAGMHQYLAIGGKTPENAPQISYYYCNKESCQWAEAMIAGHSGPVLLCLLPSSGPASAQLAWLSLTLSLPMIGCSASSRNSSFS